MGYRLKEVRLVEGRLIGLLEDGSRIQLEEPTPDLVISKSHYKPLLTLLNERISSLPNDHYVHVGRERHDRVVISYGIDRLLISVPFTVYKGTKIDNPKKSESSGDPAHANDPPTKDNREYFFIRLQRFLISQP